MQMNGCTVIKTRRLTRSNCDVKRIVKSSRRNRSLFLLFLCLYLAEDIFKRYSISFPIEFSKDFEEIYEDDIWIIFRFNYCSERVGATKKFIQFWFYLPRILV